MARRYLNNPAGRLLEALEQFRLQKPQAGGSPWVYWSSALSFNLRDDVARAINMSELAATLRDCCTAAKSLRGEFDSIDLLHDLPRWSAAIFGFEARDQFRPKELLPDSAMNSLRSLSYILHSNSPELSFKSSSSLDDVRVAADELRPLLGMLDEEGNLTLEVRSRLRRAIESVLLTVEFVNLRGAQRLVLDLAGLQATFRTAEQVSSDDTPDSDEMSVHKSISSWAASIEVVAATIYGLIAPPTASVYWALTGDLTGALLILSASPKSLEAIASKAGKMLGGTSRAIAADPQQ